MSINQKTVEKCKTILLAKREEILNSLANGKSEFDTLERGGDEADNSVSSIAEHQFLSNQNRMHKQLLEIGYALARIEQGTFGLCEETEEPISEDRLIALPWTRLSLEGAEIRDDMKKRYSR